MVSRIFIDGFKSIDQVDLQLGNLTVLSGINSAGKSTVIQALLYMIQTMEQHVQKETVSEYVVLGKFPDVRNYIKGNKEILLQMEVKTETETQTLSFKITAGNHFSVSIQKLKYETNLVDYVTSHKIVYLSADRIGVKKAYDLNIEKPQDIGGHGEYTFSFLGVYGQEPIFEKTFAYEPETVGMSLNNQVNYWLDYLIGFHIRTEIVADVDQVVATYSNSRNNRYYRAGNVGTGVTYIAEMVIAALSCKVDDMLVIENPEIHLHPRAQSHFIEFLAFLAERGLQVIVETHSDHIYNGVRKCVKKKTLLRDKVSIYFLELDETMQTKTDYITLNAEGAEEKHPYGLFDQFDDDLDELLGM